LPWGATLMPDAVTPKSEEISLMVFQIRNNDFIHFIAERSI